jgi:hypothetical protein
MLKQILMTCLVLLSFAIQAQAQSQEDGFSCGTDAHHAWLMQSNARYRDAFLHQKALLDSLKYVPAPMDRQSPPVYTIPVVVHVIHLGEQVGYQTNIPDQQILDAINGLNERYANANGNGTDIEIQFCLATVDPNGCPTSGIVRVDGSVIPGYREGGITWDGSCGVDEVSVKDLSKWPTWEYYNIWVVNDICGSVAGYAYYPNGNEYDGTVIDIVSMTYENGTLAHELGHGLNLKHTFAGSEDNNCPADNDCMVDGDEICDTPPHRTNSCGNNNPCTAEGEWLNSKLNWMSYCFPSQVDGRFTPDQRTRMRNTMLVEPRAALLESVACANADRMQFTSPSSPLCRYESRELTALPAGGYFEVASGSGIIQGNILTPTGGTQIVVAYIISQEDCTSSIEQTIAVKPAPTALLKVEEDTLCAGQSTLVQGLPTGGTYSVVSGPGSIDSITFTAQDAGEIILLYEKMYAGCAIRDTHIVQSFPVPETDIALLSSDVLTAIPDTGTFQWLRCDNGFEPIPDAIEAVYPVTSSGSYAVVSVNGICRDTSSCITVVITATHDDQESKIIIYPNPVKDLVRLEGLAPSDIAEMNLFDIRGHQLPLISRHNGPIMDIDMASFTSGVYLLEVRGPAGQPLIFKIIKL